MLIGRFLMDLKLLLKDGTIDNQWYNIYGPTSENGLRK